MLRKISFLVVGLVISASYAWSHVQTRTDQGQPVQWKTPTVKMVMNPRNRSGLSDSKAVQLVSQSMQAWGNTASGIQFANNASVNQPAFSGLDGSNAIFFTSNSEESLGTGVIASTRVMYNIFTGAISETDLLINDTEFTFTDKQNTNDHYLPDIIVHELGHVLGLDHTAVNYGAMIFVNFAGQNKLQNDEKQAVQQMYSEVAGEVDATIKANEQLLSGSHILAINQRTGEVQAAALTEMNGKVSFRGLPDGDYTFLAEPFKAPKSSVSGYWQTMASHSICKGNNFQPTFFRSCADDGAANVVNVRAGERIDLGVFAPQCNVMGGRDLSSLANAKAIGSNGGAYYEQLAPAKDHFYRLKDYSGDLAVRVIAHALYSSGNFVVELLDKNENSVVASVRKDGVGDPLLVANNLPLADYYIRVRNQEKLAKDRFPAGAQLRDEHGFYLLSVMPNDEVASNSFTDMAACTESTPINDGNEQDDDGSAGCGLTDSGTIPPQNNPVLWLLLAAFLAKFCVAGSWQGRGARREVL